MKSRVLTVLLSGLLLCGMVPMGAAAARTTIVPGRDADTFTFYGRTVTDPSGALQLFWTYSGFAVKVTDAKTVTATMSTSNLGATGAAYLNVYVDGSFEPTATIHLDRTDATYTLAADLPAGEHIIEVRKRNEAAYAASATVTVSAVSTDGAFSTPPAKAARQIEFIGDSITSGFCNTVTDGSGRYTSATVDGTMTYAVLAAKQLGAEAQVVSRSGIGFCRNTTIHGTTDNSFYPYYPRVAALPGNGLSNALWDFESNKSDVVVINLGTNDNGGTYGGERITDERMAAEAVTFLQLVREKNPEAVIIWHYGMMGDTRAAALERAVERCRRDGDDKVFFLPQEHYNAASEGMATDGHPTVQANINRSDDLARFIAEQTGWEWDATPMLRAQLQWSAQYVCEEELAGLSPTAAAAFTRAVAAGRNLLQKGNAVNEELAAASERIWYAWATRHLDIAAVLGDADGTGTIDSSDARLVLQYAVGKIGAQAVDFAAADVDGSGALDSTDARLILQYAVDKIDRFPAEE